MKVKIEHRDSDLSEKDKKLFKEFMKLLQKKYPLKKNITIIFTGERYGKMTTGSRNDSSQIKVLTKNRINRDIMRTLSHEWVHEWQITTKKQKKGPHIGGKMEDEANAKSGAITKYFEKNNKDNEELIYEDLIKQNNIIKEEKQNVVKHIILEMKKIGIEKLPYSYSSLNKFIDSKTMDVHYNKHYKGYVKKLNKALSEKDYGDLELEEIIKSISRFSKKIRNNAGGAFNHALFWKMLSPKKQELKGNLLKKIKSEFGGYQQFKNKFEELAKNSFGSGWIWLTLTKNNRLKLITTPNQDNPLMNVIDGGGYPILGLDLWEHAYYLKYQSNRDKYISNFWNCVNWEFVGQLFDSKQKKEKINENTQMSNSPKPEACSRQEVEAYRLIFNINTQVKWAFRRKIDEVMERLFPDNWYDENEYTTGEMKGLYDFRGEKGRSVLNKLNTHYVCYCILVNDVNLVLRHIGEPIIEIIGKTPKEQIQQNERLINYIDRFAERIFSEESKTLKKMYPLLNKSNKFGEKGEEYAVKKLKQKFGEKNVDAVGRLGSTQDGKDGIDCVVNINGLIKTAQIKPYSKVEKKNDNYVFFDIGVAKRYSTDLLIFQRINGDVYVFKNEKVLMNQGAYYIHETSLIDMIS